MTKVRVAVLLALISSAAAPAALSQQDDGRRPVVTAAVQVTANPSPVRAHATPLLARNPKNGELVIAEVDVRGGRDCAVHISADDGRSWFRGGDLHVKPFTDCSVGAEYGPHVMPFFDREGVLYVVTTRKRSEGPRRGVQGSDTRVPSHTIVHPPERLSGPVHRRWALLRRPHGL